MVKVFCFCRIPPWMTYPAAASAPLNMTAHHAMTVPRTSRVLVPVPPAPMAAPHTGIPETFTSQQAGHQIALCSQPGRDLDCSISPFNSYMLCIITMLKIRYLSMVHQVYELGLPYLTEQRHSRCWLNSGLDTGLQLLFEV